MLVLSRYESQSVVINGNIKVTILASDRGYVKIGIDAPKEINIVREELIQPSKQSRFNK